MTSTLTVEDAKRIMLDSVKDKYPTVVHAQFDGGNLTLMFDKPVTEDLMAKYAWVKYRKRTASYLHIRYITVVGKHYTESGLVGAVFTASITQT